MVHRIAHHALHGLKLLGTRVDLAGSFCAHDSGANDRMACEDCGIDVRANAPQLIHVLTKRFELPIHAG